MTQLLLTIEDPQEATLLKKLLTKFTSVTVSKPTHKRKTGLDEAYDDVAAGRVYSFSSVEEMVQKLNLKV